VQLPESFIAQINQLVGVDEAKQFIEAIGQTPLTSVRLNKRKPSERFAQQPKVDWCSNARLLTERPSFVADPLHHAGAYYVQESSSMFVAHVLKHIKQNNTQAIKVLDLCAAPGGKSTLVLDELSDDDLLVSNEIIKTRVTILEDNLLRWGRNNVVVTNNDPQQIAKLGAYFDVVLIDAPCSGEGMFRKDKDAISEWSTEHTSFCAQRQKRILNDALQALKPGGFVIYSTCTFNYLENEENVSWLINEHQYKAIEIPVDEKWNITHQPTYQNTTVHGYRFYPHKVKGEGFFLACLQKPLAYEAEPNIREVKTPRLQEKDAALVQPWLDDLSNYFIENKNNVYYATPFKHVNDVAFLWSKLSVKLSGIKVGEAFKNTLVPDHHLALSTHLNKEVQRIDLNHTDAIKYLRKDAFVLDGYKQGIYLITYKNIGLGWTKVLPNRINNYLPVNWRILKDFKELTEQGS
jgi:NOL1/NOP2/sun family putative RNA methylase